MKLLVDNQLPIALARFLIAHGLESAHVQDIGLDSVDDRVIWQYAAENDLVIVTKDEDFQAFANRQRGKSPQVIWVRIGNCRKVALLAVFSKILPELRDLLISGQPVIEIR